MAVERSFTHAKFICFDRCALGGLRPVEDVSGTHWALAGGLWVRKFWAVSVRWFVWFRFPPSVSGVEAFDPHHLA